MEIEKCPEGDEWNGFVEIDWMINYLEICVVPSQFKCNPK